MAAAWTLEAEGKLESVLPVAMQEFCVCAYTIGYERKLVSGGALATCRAGRGRGVRAFGASGGREVDSGAGAWSWGGNVAPLYECAGGGTGARGRGGAAGPGFV